MSDTIFYKIISTRESSVPRLQTAGHNTVSPTDDPNAPFSGEGAITDPNGDTYVGEWKDGRARFRPTAPATASANTRESLQGIAVDLQGMAVCSQGMVVDLLGVAVDLLGMVASLQVENASLQVENASLKRCSSSLKDPTDSAQSANGETNPKRQKQDLSN